VLWQTEGWVRNKKMSKAVRITLPPRADSVPLARRAAMDAARRWLTPTQTPSLALMVSEVVTNALLHAGDGRDVELVVAHDDGVVRVEVRDHGDGVVPAPRALDHEDDGGYGLYLVEQLSDSWGWSRSDRTLVWFEITADGARDAAGSAV
jgi:anti-sigma regulatory factor (Ser/Thr protein kinase)